MRQQEGVGQFAPGSKKEKKKKKEKYTRVQTVHFYRLLLVDVISKRANLQTS